MVMLLILTYLGILIFYLVLILSRTTPLLITMFVFILKLRSLNILKLRRRRSTPLLLDCLVSFGHPFNNE